MREQAEKLAEYGRYGDIYVIHAAEGETVVPMEVLEANPQIKSLLFQQMAEMGLDPERYVVGNNLNSLNPVTGMPEFFFKKIWKAVKGVLPYIAPVIGNMIAPGIGGLIATGLATKLAGGSWGDALKATAIAYGTQAVFQGFSEMGGDGRGFMTGFGEGLTAPYHAGKGLVTGWEGGRLTGENPLAQGMGSELFGAGPYEGSVFPTYDPEFRTESEKLAAITKQRDLAALVSSPPPGGDYSSADVDAPILSQTVAPSERTPAQKYMAELERSMGAPLTQQQKHDIAREFAAGNAGADKYEPFLGEYSPSKLLGLSEEGSDVMDVGLGLGATYLLGGFEGEEPEQPTRPQLAGVVPTQTGADLVRENPELFRIGIENLDPFATPPSEEETEVASPYTYPYTMFGAHGGTVNYPRQMGYINGPGTGTSDEIPAMLSDGEFVMTKRAVDGAGGPKTMYDLMRNFEMRT